MMGIPGRESLTISLAVWIQYTNVTDKQTDRHRTTAKTAHTHSRITESDGKREKKHENDGQ